MKSTDLSAYVASRILHDLSSPVTVVMAGVDTVLDEGSDSTMRQMGGQLVREGLNKLSAQLHFLRYAIGSQELNDNQASIAVLKPMVETFAAAKDRCSIDWQLETETLSNRQFRVLLNMMLIAMYAMSKDACVRPVARVEGSELVMDVVAVGLSNGWNPEVERSIAGETPTEGWGGGRIQPYFTMLLAEELGMSLVVSQTGEGAVLTARGPVAEF